MSHSLPRQTEMLARELQQGDTPDFCPYQKLYDDQRHEQLPNFIKNKVERHARSAIVIAEFAKFMLTINGEDTRFKHLVEVEPDDAELLPENDKGNKVLNERLKLETVLAATFNEDGQEFFATAKPCVQQEANQYIDLVNELESENPEDFFDAGRATIVGFYEDGVPIVPSVVNTQLYPLVSKAADESSGLSSDQLREMLLKNLPIQFEMTARINNAHRNAQLDAYNVDGAYYDLELSDPDSPKYGQVNFYSKVTRPKKLMGPTLWCPGEYEIIETSKGLVSANQLLGTAVINAAYDRKFLDLSQYNQTTEGA